MTTKSFHSFYIQTFHNDSSHIEVVHLLFCAHFMNIFSFWGVLNFDIFFCLSTCPDTIRAPSLWNLWLQKFSFLYIQTLCNDCSHIVHHTFCAHFMDISSFMGVLNLDIFSVHPQHFGVLSLVCVFCISKSFHSFILQLCIMIVHSSKMCTSKFMHFSWIFSHFLGCWITFFSPKCLKWCLVCLIWTPTVFNPLYSNFA